MSYSSGSGFKIGRAVVGAAAFLLFGALSLAAQGDQAFRGKITNCMCSRTAEHIVTLEKSETTEACAVACVRNGAKYVLSDPDHRTVYQLDNQRKPKAFAGEDVVVIGTLDETSHTIHVSEIFRALPPKVRQAKSVSIVCDACLRDMDAAEPAALKELDSWGRFDVIPNPRHADLVFLFSANPYLGDYVTRDGPDTRPVRVDITFMNVIDPRTGENLWGDSRQWGSWFVGRATKDLIHEFRDQLEAGDSHAERLLFRLDRDGDGGVSKQEFLDYMAAEFDRLDTNGDGLLEPDELQRLRVLDLDR
jgi:EF hand